jgi:hypothetical protein
MQYSAGELFFEVHSKWMCDLTPFQIEALALEIDQATGIEGLFEVEECEEADGIRVFFPLGNQVPLEWDSLTAFHDLEVHVDGDARWFSLTQLIVEHHVWVNEGMGEDFPQYTTDEQILAHITEYPFLARSARIFEPLLDTDIEEQQHKTIRQAQEMESAMISAFTKYFGIAFSDLNEYDAFLKPSNRWNSVESCIFGILTTYRIMGNLNDLELDSDQVAKAEATIKAYRTANP